MPAPMAHLDLANHPHRVMRPGRRSVTV